MIEEWESLLNEVEIIQIPNYGSEFWSLQELDKFEDETGIIFPIGYKEFCQVFGTGCFGDFISIYCPHIDFSNALLKSIKDEIIEFPALEHEKMMSKESLINLLDFGFVFGGESCGISIFWDFNSYDKLDRSYDIYWINGDCFSGDIYKIGRDFYEFVSAFCLGTKSYEILPQKEWRSKEFLQKTFTRAKPMW